TPLGRDAESGGAGLGGSRGAWGPSINTVNVPRDVAEDRGFWDAREAPPQPDDEPGAAGIDVAADPLTATMPPARRPPMSPSPPSPSFSTAATRASSWSASATDPQTCASMRPAY